MINVPVSKSIDLQQSPRIQDAVALAETELDQSGRVLLRASGTEPLIRVMVEGSDERQVSELAERLAQTVRDVAAEA